MLQFLEEEEMDIAWKSTIYRVPRGIMAWSVRAGTNSLATVDNLVDINDAIGVMKKKLDVLEKRTKWNNTSNEKQ